MWPSCERYVQNIHYQYIIFTSLTPYRTILYLNNVQLLASSLPSWIGKSIRPEWYHTKECLKEYLGSSKSNFLAACKTARWYSNLRNININHNSDEIKFIHPGRHLLKYMYKYCSQYSVLTVFSIDRHRLEPEACSYLRYIVDAAPHCTMRIL